MQFLATRKGVGTLQDTGARVANLSRALIAALFGFREQIGEADDRHVRVERTSVIGGPEVDDLPEVVVVSRHFADDRFGNRRGDDERAIGAERTGWREIAEPDEGDARFPQHGGGWLATSPDVDVYAWWQRVDDACSERSGADDDQTLALQMTRGVPAVRMSAESLEVLAANLLRVGQYPLAEARQGSVTPGFDRGSERFELRLYFGFTDDWRTKAADDLQEQGVGVLVREDIGRPGGRVAGKEVNIPEAGRPRYRVGGSDRGTWDAMNEGKTHSLILRAPGPRSVIGLSDGFAPAPACR